MFLTLYLDKKIFPKHVTCKMLQKYVLLIRHSFPTIVLTGLYDIEINYIFFEKWSLPSAFALSNVYYMEIADQILHIVCVCVCIRMSCVPSYILGEKWQQFRKKTIKKLIDVIYLDEIMQKEKIRIAQILPLPLH